MQNADRLERWGVKYNSISRKAYTWAWRGKARGRINGIGSRLLLPWVLTSLKFCGFSGPRLRFSDVSLKLGAFYAVAQAPDFKK
jgi:hypothetical protein